jgi:hypothetical protein
MSTIRLSLVSGFVLIPKHVGNDLDLIEVIESSFGGVRVNHVKTGSIVVLDGSIATRKLSVGWVSKEIDKKTTELLEIEEYISKLKKL